MKAPLPSNEPLRLKSLQRYHILDTLPERPFDDLTALACYICETPIALISLVDSDRQWFKARVGLDMAQTSRELSFCAHAILQPNEILVVPNALSDERFADNALVTGEPYIRFYAGTPLVTEDGFPLGTLCVIDRVPRELTDKQLAALEVLRRSVIGELELRRQTVELKQALEQRDRAQVALQGLNVELEAKVPVRTAELQAGEKRLREILDALPFFVGLFASDGRVLEVNNALLEAASLKREEVLNKPFLETHWWSGLPDSRSRLEASLQRVARGETVRDEFEIRVGENDFRIIDATFTPLRDSAGFITRVVGAAMDITDRQRAQTALQESERKFRALMEAAPDSIVVVDETGRITLVNAQAEALFGWSRAELLGQPVEILLPERFAKQHVQDRSRYWAAPRTRPMGIGLELAGRRKDGSEFPLEISLSPWEAGEGLRVIAAVRDITARKSLEEQLRHSQKMETIGRLAGGVAHDFNNLLTAIIGYSQLALSRLNPGERLRSDVEEILRAGERAAALTSQLLAFSRRQVLQPKVLDLNAVIANMHKMLPRLIGEDIELMTVAEPALGRVKADPGQIEQMIIKLALNARDAMPHGGKLTIETANVDLDESYSRRHLSVVPGHYILLAVSDTGVGMDAETQTRIFEPFFTTKEVGKGTGLGLSTVYGVVKQSGGNIWVYSEPNRGTTFKIYLPRVNEPAKTTVTPSSMDESLKGSETILLAEDDATVRDLARQILEMRGYTVLEAGNVGEALRLGQQRERPIDLMITDVIMPEMGGRELAQRVAALRPGMKVLYMSGYTSNAIIHHGVLDAGISFLQKPFTPDALTRKVREVLAGS